METRQNGHLNQELLSQLRQVVGGYEDRAVKYLTHRGALKQGQQLEGLSEKHAQMMLRMAGYYSRTIQDFKTPDEEDAERIAKEAATRRKLQERNLNRLWNMTPPEFEDLSEKRAPRRKQFRFIDEFFADQDQISEFEDSGKHGFIFTGDSGLGKTACLYQAIQAGLEGGRFESFEFIKSVTFFRLTKAKHMDKESQEEFTEMFHPLLKADLLCLDDVGTEIISPGAQETIFELVDTRTEHWRFTILATNDTVQGLASRFGKNEDKMRRRLEQFFKEVPFNKR